MNEIRSNCSSQTCTLKQYSTKLLITVTVVSSVFSDYYQRLCGLSLVSYPSLFERRGHRKLHVPLFYSTCSSIAVLMNCKQSHQLHLNSTLLVSSIRHDRHVRQQHEKPLSLLHFILLAAYIAARKPLFDLLVKKLQ